MNRLILVGNGFDLAHGLRTRYEHFINWYLTSLNDEIQESSKAQVGDALCSFGLTKSCPYDSFNRFLRMNAIYGDLLQQLKHWTSSVQIVQSGLLKEITRSIEIKNWVDLEQDYYNLLIGKGRYYLEYDKNADKLNNEFECLKRHLYSYLQQIDADSCSEVQLSEIGRLFTAPIRRTEIAVESLSLWDSHINSRMKLSYDEMRDLLLGYNFPGCDYAKLDGFIKSGSAELGYEACKQKKLEIPKAYFVPNHTMLLNFNYTHTADNYMPVGYDTFEINHIHGSIDNVDSMIFGYGDELDEKYGELEKKNDNEYLKNMKSIRYQETDNYRRMLSFIELEPYQVYIMGHSCGVSDRTLLNTLFEHKNCVSIKPFYHQNEGVDNYNDLIASISRNFTDKKKMRDRVVNKTYCEPLPQLKMQNEVN